MKVVYFVLFIIFMFVTTGHCEQKYNPYTGKWETVPDNSDWEMKYNPHDGSQSYQPKNAELEYNPYEGKREWNSGHNPK